MFRAHIRVELGVDVRPVARVLVLELEVALHLQGGPLLTKVDGGEHALDRAAGQHSLRVAVR